MSEQRVPILVYHHVYPDDMLATCESLSGIIGQSEYQRQIEYIAQEGWQVISMTAVLDWLTRKRVVPDREQTAHAVLGRGKQGIAAELCPSGRGRGGRLGGRGPRGPRLHHAQTESAAASSSCRQAGARVLPCSP